MINFLWKNPLEQFLLAVDAKWSLELDVSLRHDLPEDAELSKVIIGDDEGIFSAIEVDANRLPWPAIREHLVQRIADVLCAFPHNRNKREQICEDLRVIEKWYAKHQADKMFESECNDAIAQPTH